MTSSGEVGVGPPGVGDGPDFASAPDRGPRSRPGRRRPRAGARSYDPADPRPTSRPSSAHTRGRPRHCNLTADPRGPADLLRVHALLDKTPPQIRLFSAPASGYWPPRSPRRHGSPARTTRPDSPEVPPRLPLPNISETPRAKDGPSDRRRCAPLLVWIACYPAKAARGEARLGFLRTRRRRSAGLQPPVPGRAGLRAAQARGLAEAAARPRPGRRQPGCRPADAGAHPAAGGTRRPHPRPGGTRRRPRQAGRDEAAGRRHAGLERTPPHPRQARGDGVPPGEAAGRRIPVHHRVRRRRRDRHRGAEIDAVRTALARVRRAADQEDTRHERRDARKTACRDAERLPISCLVSRVSCLWISPCSSSTPTSTSPGTPSTGTATCSCPSPRSARPSRAGHDRTKGRGRGTVSFPELRRGGVGVFIATLLARLHPAQRPCRPFQRYESHGRPPTPRPRPARLLPRPRTSRPPALDQRSADAGRAHVAALASAARAATPAARLHPEHGRGRPGAVARSRSRNGGTPACASSARPTTASAPTPTAPAPTAACSSRPGPAPQRWSASA